MAGYDWEDDDFDADERGGNDVPDLRKAHRALKKQYNELKAQFETVNKQAREASLKDILAAKGLNPKVAALVPKDVDDVEEWIENYADVFGGSQPTEAPSAPAQEEPVDPNFEALQRISSAQTQGAPMTGDSAQLASLIASASDPEALNKILFGNASGPQAV